jgi:hypothetical protein
MLSFSKVSQNMQNISYKQYHFNYKTYIHIWFNIQDANQIVYTRSRIKASTNKRHETVTTNEISILKGSSRGYPYVKTPKKQTTLKKNKLEFY